jgi:putative spermidine/putrescine transport system permease protein
MSRVLRAGGKVLYEGLLALVVVFMVVPTVIVVLLSFSGDKFIRFPPQSWGTRQYPGGER